MNYYINLQQRENFSPYAVILKDSNELIGVCGFNPPNNGCDAELMYHFKKSHWGRGYATEAAKASLEYAKNHQKLNLLGASIDPKNCASQKVLAKLGFSYVGMKWCEATLFLIQIKRGKASE